MTRFGYSRRARRRQAVWVAVCLSLPAVLALPLLAAPYRIQEIRSIRFWALGDVTRVAIEASGPVDYFADRIENPDRIFFDIHNVRAVLEGGQVRKSVSIPVGDQRVKQIRIGENRKNVIRVVLDLNRPAKYSVTELRNPYRLVVELKDAPAPTEAPPPTALPDIFSRTSPPPQPRPEISAPPPALPLEQAQIAPLPKWAAPLPAAKSVPPPPKPAGPVPAVAKASPKSVASPKTAAPADLPREARSPTAITASDRTVREAPATASPLAAGEVPRLATAPAAPVSPARPEPVEQAALRTPPSSPAPRAEDKRLPAIPSPPPSPPPDEASAAPAAKPARPTSNGNRSLVRAMGLKIGRIVIDPGHGGHDTGTISPAGLREKDIVLDIALRLGKLIEERLGFEVVYTRKDDAFVPLTERTRIANEQRADLFVSIHLNSSSYRTISGAETFFLSLTNSAYALDVAARENASVNNTVYDLQELLQKIALTDKIEESREFALNIQRTLHAQLGPAVRAPKNRGIKRAPFVVLIGAQMPSVLVEVGFLSNPREEALLKTPEFRESVAEALLEGIAHYANTLSKLDLANTRATPVPPAAPPVIP